MGEKSTMCSDYWMDSSGRYALLRINHAGVVTDYLILDLRVPGSICLIEENEVARTTIENMLNARVPIYHESPGRPDLSGDLASLLMLKKGMHMRDANAVRKQILTRAWDFTDELLKEGKKYPEIIDVCADFVDREVEKKAKEYGIDPPQPPKKILPQW